MFGKGVKDMDEIIEINGVKYKRVEESTIKYNAKYKVGDWVKVIANKWPRLDCDNYLGEVAKITHVYDYGDHKRDGESIQAYGIGKMFVVHEDELEPAEELKKNMFECENGDMYYQIASTGNVGKCPWDGCEVDVNLAKVANCCKDKKLMEQRALYEVLNRLLWKASVESGELNNPWDGDHLHYTIRFISGRFCVEVLNCGKHFEPYFASRKAAEEAIEYIIKPFILEEHPDFVW